MLSDKGSERNRHGMPGEKDRSAQVEFLMIIWEMVDIASQLECRCCLLLACCRTRWEKEGSYEVADMESGAFASKTMLQPQPL